MTDKGWSSDEQRDSKGGRLSGQAGGVGWIRVMHDPHAAQERQENTGRDPEAMKRRQEAEQDFAMRQTDMLHRGAHVAENVVVRQGDRLGRPFGAAREE